MTNFLSQVGAAAIGMLIGSALLALLPSAREAVKRWKGSES